jgi:hypothetical protein
MGPRKLLVFDLETVPDITFAHKIWPETAEMDAASTTEHIYAHFRAANPSGSEFPRPSFHRIVAIGCLLADIEMVDGQETYHFRRLGCIGQEGENWDDEKALLSQWLDFGTREPLRLISFNGRNFDIPVIKLRTLLHQLQAGWLFQRGDKWSNYNSRYDMVWHVDLADVMSDFGSFRGMKLDEVCTLAGLPGKLDIAGNKVYELYNDGKLNEIRDYCETDVLNTYLLYLKYQHLTGTLATESLAREEQAIREYCEAEKAKRAHLGQFLNAWKESSNA